MARTCVIQCNLKNFPFGADSLPAEACRLFRSSGIRNVKPISYGSKEIRDVVLYFADNAETYGVDSSKFTLMGYSAGAYYAILGLLDLMPKSWKRISLLHFSFYQGRIQYLKKAKSFVKDMESAGLELEVIEYDNAVHSFIESNNPEGAVDSSVDMSDVINPEQESLAKEAEAAISEWIGLQ